MLTRPAKFTPFQNSTGTDLHPIVSLTDGVTTWLFSDTEMQLTDGHVYAGLLNGWTIDQSLDIYSKQWAVSDVTIEITNLPYRISAGADVRFSSEVANLFGGAVKIYLMAGRTATALSDCLLRFSGKATAAPTYDDQTVTITATDASRLKTVELPRNNVGTSYTSAPKIYQTKKIPLVYGKFTIDSEVFDGSGKGLARAIQVTPGAYATFVVSDHILNALTELWYQDPEFEDPVKWISPTLDEDDANHRGSGVVAKYVQAWVFPTSGDDDGYSTAEMETEYTYYPLVDGSSLQWTCSSGSDHYALVDESVASFTDYVSTATSENIDLYTCVGSSVFYTSDTSPWKSFSVVVYTKKSDGTSPTLSGVLRYNGTNYAAAAQSVTSTTGQTLTFTWDAPPWNEDGDWAVAPDDIEFGFKYASASGETIYIASCNLVCVHLNLSASGTSDCFDRSASTYDLVWDNYVLGDGSTNYPEGKFMLALDKDDWLKRIAEMADAGFDTGFKVQLKAIDNTGKVNTDREARLMYASTGSSDTYTTVAISSSSSWQEHPAASWKTIPVTSKNMPYCLGFWLKGRQADGTGDEDGYAMYIIYEARLLVKYPASGTPGIGGYNLGWAACEGREYGSWITGRSSNYSASDCIIDPAGIIESILRDELGLADSDLELTTFIDAENTSVEARINLHSDNLLLSDEAIRQLAEQSTFAFFYSANGKARLIPLNDSTPTTAVRGSHPIKIQWTHIKDGQFRVSTVGRVINYLDIQSRFMQEYDSFGDVSVVQNATSQSTYGGTYKYSANWPNISGTSVTTVANHLVGSANGIWANDHVQIEVETVGYTYADLEIGDWIEIDATSVDPFIKCYGTSWSGLQFLVTGLRQSNDGTMITAIKLY